MSFGEKLVALRKERKMSQAELGKLVGVHAGHLSRIETGQAVPSIEVLRKIVQALGVSADYLINDEAGEATPIEIQDKSMAEKLRLINDLPERDKEMIVYIIETALTKKKIQDIVSHEAA